MSAATVKCIVLETCVPDTIRYPGEIVSWPEAYDIPPYLRRLDQDEQTELDQEDIKAQQRKEDREELDPESPQGAQAGQRAAAIVEALHELNQADDSDWTKSGQPAVARVNAILAEFPDFPGGETSRSEIRDISPQFMRQAQRVAPAGAAGPGAPAPLKGTADDDFFGDEDEG